MAVQAQYPSNILLLNRNGQEGQDYSLQPQPGGYLDQSSMLLSNGGGNNQRKRGRAAPTGTTATTATINQFCMQPQPLSTTQLIDLSQLHNHRHNQPQPNPNVVSTGLRLSFGDQQQQNHQYQQQNFGTGACQSSVLLSLSSEDFSTQVKRQRDEIDQFLQAQVPKFSPRPGPIFSLSLKAVQKWMRRFHFMQGEQLRRTLAEKRQRHFRALLGAAEESIARKLREKEMEVEKATRRNAELEARATQLSIEAQVWQAKVRSQEVTAASLQAQLQQAIMNGGLAQDSRRGEDGIGCPGGVEGQTQAEDAESAYVDPDRVAVVPGGPSCKVCRKRMASVVLLPCRHLCVCTECDRVVHACPLCLHVRNSSVEVYLC
ncbi:BOI-RELATED E3 UBIQUITIN-PROTEIN LIGASE 1-LIKE [Salix purpurea]|uniref:BOI-RELATED E3 UBIQUITIN-PROTEIN LIGASE 1-LIKE n=1 Tax=Salix purpurea TaxID=77065 RepID=A0A9Q0QG46_SALPP|nr:BOI-RELATED E3 UBIQUITIN-PROTEIN LIGASE 1-LIKE [Salix purpurea]